LPRRFSDEDREEIRWYLEDYAIGYSADVDDARAGRFVDQMSERGRGLFNAAFAERNPLRMFRDFQDEDEPGRLFTITSEHPAILSLPWEMIHTPERGGNFLIHEKPRISVRRRITGITGGRRRKIRPREKLRMLFVVSRPSSASFIDPRSDPLAVLNALEEHAEGRVETEFLRPGTFDNLVKRLEDEDLPRIDIIHFDGHGVFDATGKLAEKAEKDLKEFKSLSEELVRDTDTGKPGENKGYLVFEKPDGTSHLVPADLLAEELNQQRISLVLLSACQSAAVGEGEEPMGSVAASLTSTGIPSVLAMTHSVLVSATERLFAEFYEGLARGQKIGTALDNARRGMRRHTERREIRRLTGPVKIHLQDWFLPALYQPGQDTALLTKRRPDEEGGVAEEAGALSNLPRVQEAGFWGRRRELWDIERWFVRDTRRITLSGFGGQGKTYLAQEAGRWLLRTGMFRGVVFVDYADFQGD